MTRTTRIVLASAVAVLAFAANGAHSQQPIRIVMATPRPEPIAETKLLMEGLTRPNFNGLNRLLNEAPKDAEAWKFARGQALLIAETANLLMLRPPRTNREAQDLWLNRSSDLRESAGKLALAVASQDHAKARTAMIDLSATCNRCHQSFRIATRVVPFAIEREERQ